MYNRQFSKAEEEAVAAVIQALTPPAWYESYKAAYKQSKQSQKKAVETDPLTDAAEWFGAGTLVVFCLSGFLSSPLFRFLPSQGSFALKNTTALGWNIFDANAGVLAGMAGYQKAKNKVLHGSAPEYLFSTLDIGTSSALLAGQAMTTYSLVTSLIPLIGAAAPVFFGPAGSAAFALCMVSSACRAIYHFHRAVQKTDPLYLLEDRLAKLAENQHRINEAYTNKISYRAPESVKHLRSEVKTLYAVLRQTSQAKPNSNPSHLGNKLETLKSKYQNIIKFMDLKETPSDEDRILYSLIMDKQERKSEKNRVAAYNWTAASIIMGTAAAVAILTVMHIACPPLGFSTGIAVAVVGIMKAYEYHQHHYAPQKARQEQAALLKEKVIQELADKKLIRQGINHNHHTEKEKALINQTVRDSLLRLAIADQAQTKKLSKVPLNAGRYHNLKNRLSEKHQEKLIDDYCLKESTSFRVHPLSSLGLFAKKILSTEPDPSATATYSVVPV